MDIGILLLIVFVLAPLLEKLLKAGRPQQPPPQQRRPPQRPGPVQRPRVPEQEERPFRSIPSADADADEQSAAAMLPDDLWEILTGEKRPQRAPPRAETRVEPDTAPVEAPPSELSRPRTLESRPAAKSGEQARRPAGLQRRPPAPPRARRLPEVSMRGEPGGPRARPPLRRPESPPDDYIREIPVHEAPAVVPFEAPLLDPEARRAAFKARRAQLSEAATVTRAERRTTIEFGGTKDLRRAIVMAEILGRPRGLD